jgi:hypothetical protein
MDEVIHSLLGSFFVEFTMNYEIFNDCDVLFPNVFHNPYCNVNATSHYEWYTPLLLVRRRKLESNPAADITQNPKY